MNSTSRSSVETPELKTLRPGFDLRDLLQTARERLPWLRLLSHEPRRIWSFTPAEIYRLVESVGETIDGSEPTVP